VAGGRLRLELTFLRLAAMHLKSPGRDAAEYDSLTTRFPVHPDQINLILEPARSAASLEGLSQHQRCFHPFIPVLRTAPQMRLCQCGPACV